MQLWCDTADLDEIHAWDTHDEIHGFTTNSILLAKAGVSTADLLANLPTKPICIENVYGITNVIPKVMGQPHRGPGNINHTCIFTPEDLYPRYTANDIISVFAGRIMDTGRDPYPTIAAARQTAARVLWASTREVYNIYMADDYGCDIITVPPPILTRYFAERSQSLDQVRARTLAEMGA